MGFRERTKRQASSLPKTYILKPKSCRRQFTPKHFREYTGHSGTVPPFAKKGADTIFPIQSVHAALMIVTAISIDTFACGFAYGADKIKIPFPSIMVINFICGAAFALSLLLGRIIGPALPEGFTAAVCFTLLFALGLAKLFDSAVKAYIRRHTAFRKSFRFSAFRLGFILSVYANPEEADSDRSRILSPAESAYLAIALSLDSLAVGLGAGMAAVSPVLSVGLLLAVNTLCAVMGRYIGERTAKRARLNLDWLGGAILLMLAFMNLG